MNFGKLPTFQAPQTYRNDREHRPATTAFFSH
jgi:hypothetical protein